MGFMRGLEGRNRTEAIALVQLIREQGISFGGLTRALSGRASSNCGARRCGSSTCFSPTDRMRSYKKEVERRKQAGRRQEKKR